MPVAIAADGVPLHYDEFGAEDGRPLLLLQGLGGDARGWALQRRPFGRRHRCLALDNRGVGGSGQPTQAFSVDELADDACVVLDHAGVTSADVLGLSMGASIAQTLAVRHPGRVAALVLASSSLESHEWRAELLGRWQRRALADGMAVVAREALEWVLRPTLAAVARPLVLVAGQRFITQWPACFAAQVQAVLELPVDDLRAAMATVQVPTLVVTGASDRLTPPTDAAALARLVPGAELVVLRRAAHALVVEAPLAFPRAVLRFLDGSDGR